MGQCVPASECVQYERQPVVSALATHKVSIGATPLNSDAVHSALVAYHTSISIDDDEIVFDSKGLTVYRHFASHQGTLDSTLKLSGPTMVREVGITDISVEELMKVTRPHFQPGSYDVLRKNCNSFVDCALGFLLGGKLEAKFSSLERLGLFAESNFGLAGMLIGYTPNPKAATFQKDLTWEHLAIISGHLQRKVQESL